MSAQHLTKDVCLTREMLCGHSADIVRTYISREICPHYILRFSAQVRSSDARQLIWYSYVLLFCLYFKLGILFYGLFPVNCRQYPFHGGSFFVHVNLSASVILLGSWLDCCTWAMSTLFSRAAETTSQAPSRFEIQIYSASLVLNALGRSCTRPYTMDVHFNFQKYK